MSESEAARARAERKASKRGRQRLRQAWRLEMLGTPDRAALGEAIAGLAPVRRGPRAAPDAGVAAGRWVPIGPSVVQLGQAIDQPRVTGRINDLAVEPKDGRRAYAASGNGGVWYTEDAGATWSPVGPWAERAREAGGRTSATTGGSILVEFGATAKDDVVLVGTGEFSSSGSPYSPSQGGVGILTAVGPAVLAAPLVNPWEPDTNSLTMLEGASVNRLVRQPGRTAGATTGPKVDRVAACTSMGLCIGERKPVAASPPYPERGTYDWTPMLLDWPQDPAAWMPAGTKKGAPTKWPSSPNVTDAVWLPSGRLVLAINGFGVVLSDDEGDTLLHVRNMDLTAFAIGGRISLAAVEDKRIYVLYTKTSTGPALIRHIADATLDSTKTPPVIATPVTGVPAVFGSGQGDYDQAIAVERVAVAAVDDLDGTKDGFVDRLYLGGDTITPNGANEWVASLWVMDVQAGKSLVPAKGISRLGAPPNGEGASNRGLVGNNVHPDVHVIRLAGAAGSRSVWVGCDGGVFVSNQGGRVHTFAPRVNGLATLEPGFLATHPTAPQFIAAGVQDNGVIVRTGDTVWEEHFGGDGGGVAFHPTVPHALIGQWTQGTWQCTHASFRDPLQRRKLHPNFGTIGKDREDKVAGFYSGASAVAHGANGRIAIGTNRVWVTDDLGGVGACHWVVLPFSTAVAGAKAVDARTSSGWDVVGKTQTGVPSVGPPVTRFTTVRTIKWVSDSELLAVYPEGICRWTEVTPGFWQAKVWRLGSANVAIEAAQTVTDVAPIPRTQDFYVTTLGARVTDLETVWLYSGATDRFTRTNFRHTLDTAGPTLGPLDPAYAAVVDPGADPDTPGNKARVYIGTATGVWVGEKLVDGTHKWDRFNNGLPEATVQDLNLWSDPPPLVLGPRKARMLRAAVQSRGVWEVDLQNPAVRRTFVRVHQHDDRRTLPVNLTNPRVAPGPTTNFTADSSPDIVVRPRWPLAAAPRWLGPKPLKLGSVPSAYELWLFQSAFRWLYPSVIPTGKWTRAFGDLVALDRTQRQNVAPAGKGMKPPGQLIDKQLWDAVVGTRLAADLTVSANAADQLAVASPAWITPQTPKQLATEVDLIETVVPPSNAGGVWTVYSEPSSVDVLLHHRDSRPVDAGRAWAVLLWRYVANAAAGLTASVTDVAAFHDKVWKEQPSTVDPTGWTVVRRRDGSARHPLDAVIDARMPRAVSFDVDLTPPTAPAGPQPPAPAAVVFLALVGSLDDDPPLPAPAAVTVADLVTQWPHAAARVCLLQPRP